MIKEPAECGAGIAGKRAKCRVGYGMLTDGDLICRRNRKPQQRGDSQSKCDAVTQPTDRLESAALSPKSSFPKCVEHENDQGDAEP